MKASHHKSAKINSPKLNYKKNNATADYSKEKSATPSLPIKRPSIVLRRSEGEEIAVDEFGKKSFDFSRKNASKKTQISIYKENSADLLGNPLSPNNLQIVRSKRRMTTSGVSTSGSDSEEGTTDMTDMTLSADDMIEKRPKVGVAMTGVPFLTSPPSIVESTLPGASQIFPISRWDDTYTDKDRAAAVVKGTKDIKISLLMKRKEEIRRMMPEEKGARVFLGQGVFQHTRHGPGVRATKYYDTALSMQPHSSTCYLARAKCYLESGDAKRALEDANIVLGADPGSPKALRLMAECYYQLGNFEAALLHYHRAAAIRPGDEKYVLGVAKCKRAICNAVGKKNTDAKRKETRKSARRNSSRDCLVSTTKSINEDVTYLSNLLKEKAVVRNRSDTIDQVVQIAKDTLHYLDERKTFWHSEDPTCKNYKLPKKGSKTSKKRLLRKNNRKKC